MLISLFDLFKIGIGPSSSHTTGPMRAAGAFLARLEEAGNLHRVRHVRAEVYGSLALTGKGHGTDKAIMLGLAGEDPQTVDPAEAEAMVEAIRAGKQLALAGHTVIPFDPDRDLVFNRRSRLPFHSNGMRFTAADERREPVDAGIYYSVGGGFVIDEAAAGDADTPGDDDAGSVPWPFSSSRELLATGREHGLSIPAIILANEQAVRGADEIDRGIEEIWAVMEACIDRGCRGNGQLPGHLGVERRAGRLFDRLAARGDGPAGDPLAAMDWVNLWAIAINEENAAGGRVVTAPTNGAAGIIPAVLRYYDRFCPGASRNGIRDFFLTAAGIGTLYKQNASLSGAEVGCQGEVGVACSMAAGGLTAALGGSNEQIENAAEIGMEHNLGLTCDPVGGLVQIPCIERNAMGAIKAIDASRLAMLGDGTHRISLDRAIETMYRTGKDMKTKYKETSRGGLAVNIVEC